MKAATILILCASKFNRALIALTALSLFGPSLEMCAQTPDGRNFHDLPPQMNIVGAGFNGEHGAKMQRASIYTILAGAVMTGTILHVQDGDQGPAPLVMGGLFLGAAVHLNLRGLKWEQRSYKLMQMGYTPNEYYDTLPDSVSTGDRAKLGLKDYMGGTPIHVPARFK